MGLDVNNLSNEDLLEYYTLMVELNHYEPFVSPKLVIFSRENNITLEQLKDVLLKRLNK